ncbi:hypothetical protein [Flavobacterium lacus]|uniref:PH (Pleckstrin Homology) domain-containing protein n=1 Tax=Flavobacterium lacus TaxID=1353778 RepID=A0A328WQT5_9FLAO|nr:hypothetical protein [Flavobacterium lacus]RAR48493.1 hypothetical protein B0I10_105101 [Flavobacterium lacus]
MSTKIYQLRKKPLLEFTLNENDFRLIDNDNPSNNSLLTFNSIISVEIVRGKTNWFISIFSLIIDLIFDFSSFSNYKEKDKLIIQTKNSTIEILLFKVDRREAEMLVDRFKTSINKSK